ncbi:leucyl aminopeptidase [Acaricomes phytoseiuli]|uniref:leucyl aminopeptidase n=1 Tax=Acaricomes phytoseiuli TaxID=291968 RepID=UPI00039CFAF7|nr:leucyl aminopeptidase [Acaricomes phytoseiuli]
MPMNDVVSLQVSAAAARSLPGDALVIAVAKGPDGPVLTSHPLEPAEAAALSDSLELLGVTGAADELHRLPGLDGVKASVLVLVGLGRVTDTPDAETLRRAAGSAVRQLAGLNRVVLALPAHDAAQLTAVAEGAALGAYRYSKPQSSSEKAPEAAAKAQKKGPVREVVIASKVNQRTAKTALTRAEIVGKAVNAARTLVNEPPNRLYPETFAEASRELAKGLPVKVTVYDEKRLEKEGYGGLIGVGKGSVNPPRLVKVEYAPAKYGKPGSTQHVALVGKGITFDSGGLSLKPPTGMTTMKCDMAGAAAILTATLAVAELGLPIRVTAWLCLAENMPSSTAGRPSDVITIFGGKTVEVLNTDAEGRLVMADGLVAASQEHPDMILDVATLTGAQAVALGNRYSGVMGDEKVSRRVQEAAEAVGELFWMMPIPEELRPSLDSKVADLANIGERMGGMMTAAAFLNEFVGTAKKTKPAKKESAGNKESEEAQIPWAHLDIAGPAFNEGSPYGYTPQQGTGVAVRTLLGFVERIAPLNS